MQDINPNTKAQLLVKLRDLMAKQLFVVSKLDDENYCVHWVLLNSLTRPPIVILLYGSFNILTYKACTRLV